jgi:hypothetical protein
MRGLLLRTWGRAGVRFQNGLLRWPPRPSESGAGCSLLARILNVRVQFVYGTTPRSECLARLPSRSRPSSPERVGRGGKSDDSNSSTFDCGGTASSIAPTSWATSASRCPRRRRTFATYLDLAPKNLEYDRSERVYVAASTVFPVLSVVRGGALPPGLARQSIWSPSPAETSYLGWLPPVAVAWHAHQDCVRACLGSVHSRDSVWALTRRALPVDVAAGVELARSLAPRGGP